MRTREQWVEEVMKNKTDRELLELAAKAANMDVMWDREELADFCAKREGMWLKGMRSDSANCEYWNPLTSDGDAFRLAVELQLTLCNDQVASGYAYCTDGDKNVNFPAVHSGKNENKVIDEDYVAARRAIVLAAAKIGESK